MKELLELDVAIQERQIDIIHILNDSKVIVSKNELEAHKENFAWVNKEDLDRLVAELKPQTDASRKSIIAIFETREIKTYPNVSKNFHQYNLLNRSGL